MAVSVPNPVTVGPVSVGRGRPLALICGPCVMEPNDLTPELAQTFGVKARSGAIITGVLQAGPAAKAGIRPGDVITGVGARKIDNVQELLTAVAGLKPGNAERFALQRGSDKLELEVTPGTRPKQPRRRNPAEAE